MRDYRWPFILPPFPVVINTCLIKLQLYLQYIKVRFFTDPSLLKPPASPRKIFEPDLQSSPFGGKAKDNPLKWYRLVKDRRAKKKRRQFMLSAQPILIKLKRLQDGAKRSYPGWF